MATIRSTLISDAITNAGRKGQNIDLATKYNEIVEDMSAQYPLLKHGSWDFSAVPGQNYTLLPTDFRNREMLKVSDIKLTWAAPEIFRMLTVSSGTPIIYTVVEKDFKIYLLPTPNLGFTGTLIYTRIHPKAGKILTFISGGGYQIRRDDLVVGHSSTACGTVVDMRITSGTWAGYDAAGTIIIIGDSGTFSSENLDVGNNLNVATITGAAASADNFTHLFGDEFDSTIRIGLTWKCFELIKEEVLALEWQQKYQADLDSKARNKTRIYL